MKTVYCANCGKRLNIKRKALPNYGKIIDIVEYHKCLDEPAEIDLTPVDIPAFDESGDNNKFVQKLNNLPHKAINQLSTNNFKDQRSTSSTAPRSLLTQLKTIPNSTPLHDLRSHSEGEQNV